MKKIAQPGIWIAIAVLIVGGIIYFAASKSPDSDNSNSSNKRYTAFAQCLEEKGAIFYGAYWCSHCKDQKELFEGAADDVPYVECALPGSPNTMTQECKDAGVEGYPTWIFADGSILSGTQSLETLADKSGCLLPGSGQAINDASVENSTTNQSSVNTNTGETQTEN